MRLNSAFFIFTLLFVLPQFAAAQLYSVSGYVFSNNTDKPVENVTVYESVSGIGTITDSKGYYKLLLQKGNRQLKISCLGNQTQIKTFSLASDTIISVKLNPRDITVNTVAENNKTEKDSIIKKLKVPNSKKRN